MRHAGPIAAVLARLVVILALCLVTPAAARADEKRVQLYAPRVLVDSGLLKYILPRFSLKHGVRVTLVEDQTAADMVLGEAGKALFQGLGRVWRMQIRSRGHKGTERLAAWLQSEVGQRAINSFAPGGTALFGPAEEDAPQEVALTLDGDAKLGLKVSRSKCSRCHRVDDRRGIFGIGSTPSFAVLRSLADWQERFSSFYTRNPHPSFTIIEDITPPFPENRPPPLVPLEMTVEELEAVLAYVAGIPPATLR
ncbi:MAG: hypothetical protein D6754_12750 [Alphaproteobacteria bacterium]|nr:MAG: hypothetical protein D6754_12750 [Alphaproteobacteria bacterium]